ncbi:MAG: CRTAC1 family protein [Emcibacteraceae bacterium]|nr:CRTAC1 family protein [Emcibacteraceae bacterium]
MQNCLKYFSVANIMLLPLFVIGTSVMAQEIKPDFSRIQPDAFGGSMALSNAWGDYDNDGDLDLVISFKTGDVRLYNNELGGFTNVGPALGLPTGGKERRSIAWGDYNADGYLDLYVGSNRHGNELFRNDKSQGFVEVSRQMGVDMPQVSARQINWIDYDNNGTLDLFVADRIGPNFLFSNDGEKFTDVSVKAGLADPRATVGACWFDYNSDGLLDLFLANQGEGKDAFYKNDGGTFTDVAGALGLEGGPRTRRDGGVDCAVGDYNNDGHLDLFVATYGINKLYKNNGDGAFDEVSSQMGIEGNDHMVGASWGDYDNDGLLDLFVAGYHDNNGVRSPHDRLFHNDGDRFSEIDTQGTALNGADHGVQWADFDNDGDLDISLTEGYNIAGRHPVAQNNLSSVARNNSLQITVTSQNGVLNRAGSEVRIYNLNGELLGLRMVTTGDGYNSQSNQPVHFALPDQNEINVEVTFLTEQGRRKQTVQNVKPSDFIGKSLFIKQQ